MRDLTDRQREILRYIAVFSAKECWPPTIRDIQHHFGIASPNGVVCHLKSLQDKGYIARRPNGARCIKLLKAISATTEKAAVV
jgi:repressor LexA